VLDSLDAEAVRRWSRAAVEAMESHQREINVLNVFPIADSDTGTNLLVTLRGAAAALDAAGDVSGSEALAAFARGAVLSARGNSGVIVAQVLRGFADAASGAPACDAKTIGSGLSQAAAASRSAVADPVEGTILTVVDAAALAATDGASLGDLLITVTEAADAALQATPSQLAVLAEAGVVDAGGRGLVLLLDALARTVGVSPRLTAPTTPTQGSVAVRETGSAEFGYEVQFLLEAEDDDARALQSSLAKLGDSVVVVGTGDGTFNVHVHVNDVGAAIEAGIAAGRPRQVSVVRFSDAHTPGAALLVAIGPGAGLEELFSVEGVQVVGTDKATVDGVLAAIDESAAHDVVLLPNVSLVGGVAESVAEQARARGLRVAVVPTRSPMQGLAAVAVHDPSRRFDDDVVAMAEAAAATRFAEVTVADAEALTSVGICQPGDVLGLIDGDVVEHGADVGDVALAVVDRLLGVGAELLTMLVGGAAPIGLGQLLSDQVRRRTPLTEVTVYDVREAPIRLIIGVE